MKEKGFRPGFKLRIEMEKAKREYKTVIENFILKAFKKLAYDNYALLVSDDRSLERLHKLVDIESVSIMFNSTKKVRELPVKFVIKDSKFDKLVKNTEPDIDSSSVTLEPYTNKNIYGIIAEFNNLTDYIEIELVVIEDDEEKLDSILELIKKFVPSSQRVDEYDKEVEEEFKIELAKGLFKSAMMDGLIKDNKDMIKK